jgi:APA family basic amino acid/polyamine antiporter
LKLHQQNTIGFWKSLSLVMGNMIGSGIFLLPAALAAYGSNGIAGWIFSFIGAALIALLLGRLSEFYPNAAGGPYSFTLQTWGRFPAFIVAWCYWTSIWFANAAIVVALLGYLSVFIPWLNSSSPALVAGGWFILWLFTWFNTRGILLVGRIQLFTTLLKITPLFLVGMVGLFFINFRQINIEFNWSFNALTASVTLTFFAFLGLESATITGDKIKNSQTMVRRATIYGTIITAVIYLLSSFTVMALLGQDKLAESTTPFADATAIFIGPSARYVIAAAAVVATAGALNGWTFLQGHIPLAAAKDGLFPDVFQKVNQYGAPQYGIIITTAITSILLLFNYLKDLVSVFTLAISLSTLAVMVPYLFSIAAYLYHIRQKRIKQKFSISLSVGCSIFLIWVMKGYGWETILLGSTFILSGLPVYLFRKKNK